MEPAEGEAHIEVPQGAAPGNPRRLPVKFARHPDMASRWGWVLLLCLVPLLVMALMLSLQNGKTSLHIQLEGALTSSRVETLEAIQALNATLLSLQKQIQGSQKELVFGQGKLKKSLQQLDKDVSKLRSAQASAAEERRGIKAQVAEVKGRVQDGQPQSLAAAAEDISMLPGAMVIVEARAHKDLQYVLENFDTHMPLNYDLYIFHPASKADYFQQAARNVALHRHVVYIPLDVEDFPVYDQAARWYNNLLRSKEEFWDKIEAEKVLTFQVDAVLCGNSPRTIHDFEHLGYIGCGYDKEAGKGRLYWDDWPFWGNGGVTYHRKSKALECIEKFQVGDGFAEDVFYSQCVGGLGIGRRAESGTHLSEFCFTLGPFSTFAVRTFAAHKVNNNMDVQTGLDLFLDYCPEAKPLTVNECVPPLCNI